MNIAKKIFIAALCVSTIFTTSPVTLRAAEDPAIQIKKVTSPNFELAWWDKGSGGVHDGAYYKPKVSDGYRAVGYYGQSNYTYPSGYVYAVKPIKADAVKNPVSYEMIWNDKGSGADMDGYFWQPIPPEGYVAMGMVVTNDINEPDENLVVCIKKEYVLKAQAGAFIWDDVGTHSDVDFGSWKIDGVTDGKSAGTFFGIPSHTKPSENNLLWCFNSKYVKEE